MIDYSKHLNALRDKLGSGNMSLMVGSGFSKNVSKAFPDWKELLRDLTIDLYRDEIEALIPSNLNIEERNKALIDVIDRKIDSLGYLNIVSKFIKKKGIGESIVTYIEERTPIIKEDEKYYLLEQGHKIPLTQEHLVLHRTLMGFPWNNVYTTNYDPLLECCVNTDEYELKHRDNLKLAQVIEELSKNLRLAELDQEKLQIEIDKRSEETRLNNPGVPDIQAIVFKNNQDLLDQLSVNRRKIEALTEEKKSCLEQISQNEMSMMNSYTLVKEASALRLKRNKNIIKLHGSLRTSEERASNHFGFDRDPHKQYVISAEHYETYPQKHEAFTQLMRISLLQESFCLIGFSGVDPNFLSWIGWVRDLLYMHVSRNKGNPTDYKIYFIDLEASNSQPDKLLFYENNSILRIPLLSKEVIRYLSEKTRLALDPADQFRSALSMLFYYLSEDEKISASSIRPISESQEKKWQAVWDGLVTYGKEHTISAEHANNSLTILNELHPKLGLPNFPSFYLRNQQNFLWSLDLFLKSEKDQKQRSIYLQIALHALERYFVPPRTILSEDAIQELLNNPVTSDKIKLLIYRNETLKDPTQPSSDYLSDNRYEDILRTAFSFRYDLLKEKLLLWQPSIQQIHLKAGFLAAFDLEQAEQLIQNQLRSYTLTESGRLRSLELLRNITISIEWENAKKISKYISAGYPLLIESFKYLQGKLEPQTVKPMPRGKGRYSISSGSTIASSDIVFAYQYLYLLMESGFQVRIKNTILQDSSKWYYVFKNGFRNYPFPYIFYTLQYSDENFILRAAQDVAFTEDLPHDQISSTLFDAYWTIPQQQQDSLLLFLSELMQVVSPEIWQDQFFKIWKNFISSKVLFNEHETAIEKFVRSGLHYIEKEGIVFELLEDMLTNRGLNTKQIISYLYHLSNNLVFKKVIPSSIPAQLSNLLDSIIKELPKQPSDNIFLLGNLHYLLTGGQQSEISKELVKVNYAAIRHVNTWRILLHFIPDQDSIRDNIKVAIIQHRTLWYTGINGDSISRGQDSMLSIDAVTQSLRYPKGLRWNTKEIAALFSKMKVAFTDITRILEKENFFYDFVNELEEMYMFLLKHKNVLSAESDYAAIFNQVKRLFFKHRGYSNLSEGLVSSDQGTVLYALGELSIAIEEQSADPQLIRLLLSKILLQSPPAIEASLEYLSFWIEDEKNAELLIPFSEVIFQILQTYQLQPLHDCDMAFVDSLLIKIAIRMSMLKQNISEVEQLIIKGSQSRFNASRQRAAWFLSQQKVS
jgi:hypothetical protein